MEILTLKHRNMTAWDKKTLTSRQQVGRRNERGLPILCDVSRGPPGEGVVVPAVRHGDADGADGHADSIGLVVDRDGAEVRAQFVFVHLLRANQLAVHHHTFRTGERREVSRFIHLA